MIFKNNVKMFCKRIKFKIRKFGIHTSCKHKRIKVAEIKFKIMTFCRLFYKSYIERRVMCNKYAILTKLKKLTEYFFDFRCVSHHTVRNTRKFHNIFGYRLTRINECRPLIDNLTVYNLYRTDFGDIVFVVVKSCCFYIEHNKR